MDFNLIFSVLIKIAAIGCIFVILFFLFKKVKEKVPEPLKEIVTWLELFVLIGLGFYAIFFIANLAGLDSIPIGRH